MTLTKPAHEIIYVESGSPLEQKCIDVRIKVFVDEQKFPLDTEVDKYDAPGLSSHFLLRLLPSLEPVGTVRIVLKNYKVGRLCVLSDYRKYGFGRDLMQKCTDHFISELSTVSGDGRPSEIELVLHSQLYVKPFYARFGYVEEGEEFDEDGAPHQKMVLRLKANGRSSE